MPPVRSNVLPFKLNRPAPLLKVIPLKLKLERSLVLVRRVVPPKNSMSPVATVEPPQLAVSLQLPEVELAPFQVSLAAKADSAAVLNNTASRNNGLGFLMGGIICL